MEILLIALLVCGATGVFSPTVRGGAIGAGGAMGRAVGRESARRWAAGRQNRERAYARHRTRMRESWLGRAGLLGEDIALGAGRFLFRDVLPVAWAAAREAPAGARAGAGQARERRRQRRARRPLSRGAAIDILIGEGFDPQLVADTVDFTLGFRRTTRVSRDDLENIREALRPVPTQPVPPAGPPPAGGPAPTPAAPSPAAGATPAPSPTADPAATTQEGSDDDMAETTTEAGTRSSTPDGTPPLGDAISVPEGQARLVEARAKLEAARASWLEAAAAVRALSDDVNEAPWNTKEIGPTFTSLAEAVGERDAVEELTREWLELLGPCDKALSSAITTVGEPAAAIDASGDTRHFQPA